MCSSNKGNLKWKDSNLGKWASKKTTFSNFYFNYNDLIICYFDIPDHCMTTLSHRFHTAPRHYANKINLMLAITFVEVKDVICTKYKK